jgi:hypothetical protein
MATGSVPVFGTIGADGDGGLILFGLFVCYNKGFDSHSCRCWKPKKTECQCGKGVFHTGEY